MNKSSTERQHVIVFMPVKTKMRDVHGDFEQDA